MTEITVMIEAITIKGNVDAAITEALGVKYAPFKVNVESDHARYIEFGTNGVGKTPSAVRKRTGGAPRTGTKSEAYENIRKWVKARFPLPLIPNCGSQNQDQLAYAIYRKIMEEGIPPQPFIRPSILAVQTKMENGTYEDMTMEDIAKDLAAEMKRMLDENLASYGQEELANSIWVSPITAKEALANAESWPVFDGADIPDYIWNDPEMDLNGSVQRTRERKARLKR